MTRQRTQENTREIDFSTHHGMSNAKALFREVDAKLQQEVLDEEEQSSLIRSFEDLQHKQDRSWRAFFGILSVLLGSFYLWTAFQQSMSPWELRHVGEFRSVVDDQSNFVVVVLVLQTMSLVVCGWEMLGRIPATAWQRSIALRASLFLSSVGAAYWSWLLLLMKKRYPMVGIKLELIWMPFAPLAVCLTCIYIVSSLAGTASELSRLKAMRYAYKKV